MKEQKNLYYTFEKDGNTVKSEKSFGTLHILRTYAKKDMQENRIQSATIWNNDEIIGSLEYTCGSLPVFKKK